MPGENSASSYQETVVPFTARDQFEGNLIRVIIGGCFEVTHHIILQVGKVKVMNIPLNGFRIMVVVGVLVNAGFWGPALFAPK